jgi:hypothetical protein
MHRLIDGVRLYYLTGLESSGNRHLRSFALRCYESSGQTG